MNTDTGEIVHLAESDFRARIQAAIKPGEPVFTKSVFELPPILDRIEAKATGKCNYDPDALAAEMLTRSEQGPLIELRCEPNKDCPECGGSGHAGRSIGNDGKFHACRCCAMPLHWCNVHQREATHLETAKGSRCGLPRCNPVLSGIAMPCECVDLTGIAELF